MERPELVIGLADMPEDSLKALKREANAEEKRLREHRKDVEGEFAAVNAEFTKASRHWEEASAQLKAYFPAREAAQQAHLQAEGLARALDGELRRRRLKRAAAHRKARQGLLPPGKAEPWAPC